MRNRPRQLIIRPRPRRRPAFASLGRLALVVGTLWVAELAQAQSVSSDGPAEVAVATRPAAPLAPPTRLLEGSSGGVLQDSALESSVTGSRVWVAAEGASANSELRVETVVSNLYGVNALVWNTGANASQNVSINVGGVIPGLQDPLSRHRAVLSPSAGLRAGQGLEDLLGSVR